MAQVWKTAVLVLLALSLQGCSLFGIDGETGEDTHGKGPGPSPSPGPSGGTTTTTTLGMSCSKAFDGCGSQLNKTDDAACFVSKDDAKSYPKCNDALKKHFEDYKSKKDGDPSAFNELVLGGATGTCLTALRIVYTDEDKACPMPLPPPTEEIKVSGDEFNLMTLGDWGPSLPGRIIGDKGCVTCPAVPRDQCRDSLWYYLERAPALCGDWEHNNNAQQEVADAMAKYAATAKPVAVVNVGDNFYIGGIPTPANTNDPGAFGNTKATAFETTWRDVYLKNEHGTDLSVPWLSILGNHDYGGAGCQADWQVQIDFSKEEKSWRMPWQYYKQHIQADSYDVDIFMLEVNLADFLGADEHSICQQPFCYGQRGETGLCKSRVQAKQALQRTWLETELQKSVEAGVRWRILVGHFAIDPEVTALTDIGKKYGAALYVAGHLHENVFKEVGKEAPNLPTLITGAGGGYRQEGDGDFYGFGNMKFTKDKIQISIMDTNGKEKTTKDIPYTEPPSLADTAPTKLFV